MWRSRRPSDAVRCWLVDLASPTTVIRAPAPRPGVTAERDHVHLVAAVLTAGQHGRPDLADVVQTSLPAVPPDPFTGELLEMRSDDHSGKRLPRTVPHRAAVAHFQ